MDSEVPCLRKQRDWRGLNPCVRQLVRGVNRSATDASTEEHETNFKDKGEPNKAKSPHVRESGFRNPGIFCSWNPESWALESGIQH